MNQKILFFNVCSALLAGVALADEARVFHAPQEPVSFEQAVRPSEKPDSPAAESEVLPVAALTAGNTVEAQINRALLAQDWVALDTLLRDYAAQPQYDTTLYRYALGALRRHQFRHGEAADLYREIVEAQPELAYPRFDLGVMLFEDRQYREAAKQLQQAFPALPPDVQELAARYLKAAQAAQGWQPALNLNYEQTDNVNNASSVRSVEWGGKVWQKSADSLPQSAHGLRYALGLERTPNVAGNHFLRFGISGRGIHYWDAHDYSEQSLRATVGYRWQNSRRSWGVQPFIEQNWLGGQRYASNIGLAADYQGRLNDKWRISQHAQYQEKHYQSDTLARRYNSRMTSAAVNLSRNVQPNALVYGGIHVSNDDTKEREQASWRYGVSVGGVKVWPQGWGVRANALYTRREFKAPAELVYPFTRRDHEYQAGLAVWHQKISWRGFTPQLNLRYAKIDSNMPAFYSRSSKEWFVSIEKEF